MRDQSKYLRDALAVCLPAVVGALLLAACGDRSVSGTYVSHTANDAILLQITETPDHRFTGTTRSVSLNNDGTLAMSAANVVGSVDGSSLTLTVQATPLPVGQNFGGTVTANGIDLTVAQGAQTGVQRFVKGETADFDAVVTQLNAAGAPVIAARQRGQQVDQLNRQVATLSQDLNAFVVRSHDKIDKWPRATAYYGRAVEVEQAKLKRAQQLAATGNSVAQGQAGVVVGQMGVDKAQISITDDNIAEAEKDEASREATLDAGIARWNATCLDGHDVKPADLIPDMGPCKELTRAVAAYRAVLPPLHNALTTLVQAKAHGNEQLATIWRAMDNVH
ncbi:hypothetical protein LGM69_25410 [Burkholderia multivorans]|nr:hypothetical protein [Burkholderia multivorans]